jgi:hypothetical protein
MATVFGWELIVMPSTPAAPASIDWTATDTVAVSRSPFTGQQQTQNWRGSWLEGSVKMPPMKHGVTANAWIAFLLGLQGMAGVFQIGDPLASSPQGTGAGTIVVNGASQIGYSLAVSGGTGANCLLPGDFIQIGYRLYRNLSTYNGGAATLSIWPPIRESPLDATAVVTSNTKGLFRLKSNTRGWSINKARHYGISFDIVEAL